MKAPANAAVSAYAAAGGRAAIIIAPPSTSLAKTAQFHTQGAAAALILGICPDTSAVERRVPNIFYVSHNWRLFFFEGKKTLADRLWESLGFATPDHVVVPSGQGGTPGATGSGSPVLAPASVADRALLAGSQIALDDVVVVVLTRMRLKARPRVAGLVRVSP